MQVDPRFPTALVGDEQRRAALVIAEATGLPSHDVLVVLGSGLSAALDGWGAPRAGVRLSELPGVAAPVADGHEDRLDSYERAGLHVLVARGRTHLYEGVSAGTVTALARAAAAGGVHTAILCNANGCLRDWRLGDVMAVEDHLNFSGTSPFDGPLFLDVSAVWDGELTEALADVCQRRGTYAILRGPEYQTRAETRWLATTGADCVGMSTVMEAITLHALGVRVCGMSVVSDLSFAEAPTDPNAVVEAAAQAGQTLRAGVEKVLTLL
ncbi:purine-nucleoside phosphorylase [Schaalia sp. 19OD2882]|uniref:purine-nucleoside phosphorylase n=1 Tax=Schaalia sp. 19OD2882 TaxID=2794089 RepID=UPI001C1EAECB|nr:purine-nucleoside phosphorylase [Schaalia sp. 19OD2882]QWW19090.1 purine-nucleoside phosphorylase [Schaalia sp. 19OD2882]